ncbi:MAG: LCP family protein [Ruaniaceae bacterium]|nr:LCP family protein [Ruaniaceae bacterium]
MTFQPHDGDTAPVPAGQGEPGRRQRRDDRPKNRGARIAVWTLVAIVGIAAVAAGAVLGRLASGYEQAERLPQTEVFPEAESRPDPIETPEEASNEPLNILVLGSDTRGEVGDNMESIRGQRSDTIMVVNIPADRESINIMSIMRDNWVEIPGRGMNKINAAMSFGGIPLTVQTIEGIIDVPIDHVAVIDFEGFKGLTDAVGGVTLNNPNSFSAGGTTFAQGEITLQGEEALTFVRERYAFAGGDYTRVANQQLFMKALISQVLSRDTLTSPTKIIDSVDAISPYLTVDDGLGVTTLVPLGMSMSSLRGGDVNTFTSPTLGTGMVGSQSVVHPDWDRLAELAVLFREDAVGTWVP